MTTLPEEAVKAAATALANYIGHGMTEKCVDKAKVALTAAAPHLAAVRVKKLEWRQEENGDFIAESVIGWYHIGLPHRMWNLTKPNGEVPSFWTLDEAKAAAQADYEARILSALEPSAAREMALEEIIALCKDYAEDSQPDSEYRLACNDIIEALQERRTLSSPDHADAGKVEGDGWLPITEENLPPRDVDVILGYWGGWPQKKWFTEIGFYGSTRGGWVHGSATHWLPLGRLPSAPASEGAE